MSEGETDLQRESRFGWAFGYLLPDIREPETLKKRLFLLSSSPRFWWKDCLEAFGSTASPDSISRPEHYNRPKFADKGVSHLPLVAMLELVEEPLQQKVWISVVAL